MLRAHQGQWCVLPMRQRAQVINNLVRERLTDLLPRVMREEDIDMWVILCQEDDLDPVFQILLPMDTWCPILQILVFYDRGLRGGVEYLNLSMTQTQGLYEKIWSGRDHEEQWSLLCQVVRDRDPRRIGINIGSVAWVAGGLTHNLYAQLVDALPTNLVGRLVSAEPLITRFLSILTPGELSAFDHVVAVGHRLLAGCYSRDTIVPGVTTTSDLEWAYWQAAADLGLDLAFKPFYNLVRSRAGLTEFGEQDQVIRAGDMVHSDVGIKYLRLNSDHQQWAYVLRRGESTPPAGLRHLMAEANRLQDVFVGEFRQGLTGNELLKAILSRARAVGIPGPKVYSHNLGLFLHEPGPLIGLPWEQEHCAGRGDVVLEPNQTFTMELSVTDVVPEWDGQEVTFSIEEDVAFTEDGCFPVDGRQTEFYLI
ncbi:MAG: M24 family metallopeptidase [Anaerolineae bacterium]|nr:M24 family metallopeptidase [Anaerolineae bacterium]